MDVIQVFLFCIVVGFIIYLTREYFGKRSGLPPGPLSFPFIGNLHLVDEHLHETLANLSNKYGPILTFDFGQLRMVVVSDFPTAKEVLVQRGAEFAGRPMFFIGDLISHGGKDIALSDYGKRWKFHRKIAHSALRMFGEGMNKLEDVIGGEVKGLCRRFEDYENKPFDPADDIQLMVMNVICTMLFAGTFRREDPKFVKFKDNIHHILNGGSLFNLYDVIPALKWLPWKDVRLLRRMIKEMDTFLSERLEIERDNAVSKVFGKDIQVTNYIQSLLKAEQEAKEENQEAKNFLTEDLLIPTIFDLFIAGAETTTTAIKWCLLYLAMWPEIQENVQRRIDEEIGKPNGINFANLSQRQSLPYVEAVMMETQRLGSIAPLGVFHKAMKDTTLRGFKIPKGTGVVINQWAIHHDESYWKDPFEFDPTRFLDTNGKIIRDSSRPYIPFGAGPRVCLGEALARTELFLCLGNLLHRFQFSFPPDEEKPSLQGISKATLCPRPYRLIATWRY